MELTKNTNVEEKKKYWFNSIVINTNNLTLPKFSEQPNFEWVSYGANNLYPNELFNLFSSSGSHNAIIESKIRIMCGDCIVQDPDEEPSDRTQVFIEQPNPYESMDEVFRKVALDYSLYGLAYLDIIWSKDRKSIAEIYHIDASKVRWGKMNDKNKIDTYYYSRDWSNYRKEAYRPIAIPVYSSERKDARQIFPIIRYTPTLDYYTYPDYVAGLKWISIDTEIANFHYSNLKNGFQPSLFIGFPAGATTEEERQIIDDKLRQKYQGTSKAGEYILAFYDGEGSNKPEISVIGSNDLDKQFDLLNKTTLQQILVAHKVTNENLVGISTPGKLGSANEVIQNYNLYYNSVIKPEQQFLLDKFNTIMYQNGMNDITIVQNTPVNTEFEPSIMKEILTQDEMREIIGYEPLTDVQPVETATGVTYTRQGHKFHYVYDFAGLFRINGQTDLNQITNENLQDLYLWRKKNEKNPCPACIEYDGQTRTLENWLYTAIPGQINGQSFNGLSTNFPFNPYSTFCESECQCELRKIGRSA